MLIPSLELMEAEKHSGVQWCDASELDPSPSAMDQDDGNLSHRVKCQITNTPSSLPLWIPVR